MRVAEVGQSAALRPMVRKPIQPPRQRAMMTRVTLREKERERGKMERMEGCQVMKREELEIDDGFLCLFD